MILIVLMYKVIKLLLLDFLLGDLWFLAFLSLFVYFLQGQTYLITDEAGQSLGNNFILQTEISKMETIKIVRFFLFFFFHSASEQLL